MSPVCHALHICFSCVQNQFVTPLPTACHAFDTCWSGACHPLVTRFHSGCQVLVTRLLLASYLSWTGTFSYLIKPYGAKKNTQLLRRVSLNSRVLVTLLYVRLECKLPYPPVSVILFLTQKTRIEKMLACLYVTLWSICIFHN